MSHPRRNSNAPVCEAGPALRLALGHLPSHLRLWTVAILGVIADLWTKEWAFRELDSRESRVLIEDLCSLQVSLNPGALFGWGAGFAQIFVAASVLALLFVLFLFANSAASRWSMHIALGLVLAGAIGNLYDRATQEAYVAYFPGRRPVVGILEGQTEKGVTISDFPNGTNSRFVAGQPDEAASGIQPVVRDFVKIEARIGNRTLWPWVFNVADALLGAGVVILLLNFWRDHKHHQQERKTAEA